MATGLSSNWKKLQATIKAESATGKPAAKRKAATQEPTTTTTSSPAGQTFRAHKRPKPLPQKPTKPSRRATPAAAAAAGAAANMGVSQSSRVTHALAPATVAPSLGLWALRKGYDNNDDDGDDVSPEDIAEAYGLGVQAQKDDGRLRPSDDAAAANAGLTAGLQLGKFLGLDCEMVGVGPGGYESELARVSVVDFHGRQVYDSLVRPRRRVTDWRTHVSGVCARDMRLARDFADVQAQVADLLRGRVLVGHDLGHDLAALELQHPPAAVRDTAKLPAFRRYGNGPKPALRVLAKEVLGLEIQSGHHSSVEDARVAMLLFRSHKPQFDVDHMNRYPAAAAAGQNGPLATSGKTKQKNKKKKRKN